MEPFLAAMIVAATPFLLAGMGELAAERAGVLNLGVEGMMLFGAVAGFAAAFSTGSLWLGALAGAAAGASLAALFAGLTLGLMANQAATGLALTIFGIGASGLLGQPFIGQPLPAPEPLVQNAPFALGRLILGQSPATLAAFMLVAASALVINRTRLGLSISAVGHDPRAAHALGLRIDALRLGAVLYGGAMAGFAGAYMSTVYTPLWGEGMTAGRGWIALALVVFAGWRPWRLVLGAYFFAAATQLQFAGQGWGLPVPSQFLAATPYLATIAALVLFSARGRADAPGQLGRNFRPDR